MHTKNFLVDDSSNGEAVEAVSESFPKLHVVSSFAFVIKSINSVDGGTFVISSEKEEILRVFDFVCHQQADGLQALSSPINVITKKKIVGIWREAAIFKEAKQVVILTMNITNNL